MSRRHGRGRHRNNNNRGRDGKPNQNPQNQQRGGQPRRDGGRGRQQEKEKEVELLVPTPKRYGVLFYDTFAQAKSDAEAMAAKAKEVDQLNIVVKAEGSQTDEELLKYGKLFAGEAWYLIHTRRSEEGWYNGEPR